MQGPCHDLQELGKLPGCALKLHITGSASLMEFFKQLMPLRVDTLCITALKLTIREQRLLSRCKVLPEAVLRMLGHVAGKLVCLLHGAPLGLRARASSRPH